MEKISNTAATSLLLLDFMSRHKHEWWRLAEKYGLTPVQLHTLELLSRGSTPMNSLGNALVCDASNITGIVDRLEAQELIERREHPTDRRIKIVALTQKGKHVRQQIIGDMLASRSSSLSALTSPELAEFHRLLSKLTAANQDKTA